MIQPYALIALVGGAASVFALQNLDPVVIRFLLWQDDAVPLALVMLLCITAGAFLASLIAVVRGGTQDARIRVSSSVSPRTCPPPARARRIPSRPGQRSE